VWKSDQAIPGSSCRHLESVGKLLKNSRKAPGKLLKFHCKI